MINKGAVRRGGRSWPFAVGAALAMIGGSVHLALGEERKFVVTLATSPKSQPNATLVNPQTIRQEYFDRTPNNGIFSFAEYWSEISYGDITITGDVFGWVTLPWRYVPQSNALSPATFVNLRRNVMTSEGRVPDPVPDQFAYGAGEDFCDSVGDARPDTAITTASCGKLIITDFTGNDQDVAPPVRQKGFDDKPAVGINVWTPGERFLDLDGDLRWDGYDEADNTICYETFGCRSGDTCSDGTFNSPCACSGFNCGDLDMPWIDHDGDGVATNCTDCVIPNVLPDGPGRPFQPTNCLLPTDGCNPNLDECCDPETPGEPEGCVDGDPGIDCVGGEVSNPIMCCEFHDRNVDNVLSFMEPFEDFMIRWDPNGTGPQNVWVPVDDSYITNNYPGDATRLKKRTGNGVYDSPDVFLNLPTTTSATHTKMMQDGGNARFAYKVPKPGKRLSSSDVSNTSAFRTEREWFDQMWQDRYGTTPPAWPGGTGENPPYNSPRMRPFDPARPTPATVAATNGRRWFRPNRGGSHGNGTGTLENRNRVFDNNNFPELILPEESFGYYDGWVEHDDLPSSKYHAQGDKRLGEIMAPRRDQVSLPTPGGSELYLEIFGADLGEHDPGQPLSNSDQIVPAAGPYAVNVHGEKGLDGGDVCIVEWLTWRTNGQSRTIGHQWELDNGTYHPFAGPSSPRTGGSVGFRDYNLDGMIDQGEVRPAGSDNYSADSDFATPNDGTNSKYPFNRRRLMEDVVEALDTSVAWGDFVDVNSAAVVQCSGPHLAQSVEVDGQAHPGSKVISAQGLLSGIILTPASAFGDLFPLRPDFEPIHNEDNDDSRFMVPDFSGNPFEAGQVSRSLNLFFHELVTCMNCQGAPAATVFAAHEYLHSWQNFPDLYDYDIFIKDANGQPIDQLNCPIGQWDIMANVDGASQPFLPGVGLAHSIPILKESRCTEWTSPINLRSVLTPGVETTLTLPPSEVVRDSYFYLDNEDHAGERYYLWSAGSRGAGLNLPGEGMLILHTDIGANPEALPRQQRFAPFGYEIVQADGLDDLQGGTQCGDDGDPWPGSTGATQFGPNTNPSATWRNPRALWTGLNITNIVPDGAGSVRLTLSWTPANIPSLTFINPPGGQTVNGVYNVKMEATDVFGETTIRVFRIADQKKCSSSGQLCSIHADCAPNIRSSGGNSVRNLCVHDLASAIAVGNPVDKTTGGTTNISVNWNPTGLNDRFVMAAKLSPGSGPDGTERKNSTPVAGRNNVGNGTFSLLSVNIDETGTIVGQSRLETWTATYVGGTAKEWIVHSNVTQPVLNQTNPSLDPYPKAKTGEVYPPANYALPISFRINAGTVPFQVGDTFTFTTTGVTAVSQSVTVINGLISLDPVAVIVASPLSGDPPLTVHFDGRLSRDPNGEPLQYRWDFNDGKPPQTGSQTDHVYVTAGSFTAVLTVTNANSGRIGQAQVDIEVINNAPNAKISADKTSGRAPLEVQLSASQSSDRESTQDKLIYQWAFGDGTSANDAALRGLASQSVPHTYFELTAGTATGTNGQTINCSVDSPCCTAARPCQFPVLLTVTDEGGKTDTDTLTIRVGNTNPTPVIRATSSLEGPAPLTVRFNAKSSFDLDGDTMQVEWIWGDGKPNEKFPSTGPSGSTTGDVEHTYSLRSGETTSEYQMRAVVRDSRGGESAFGPLIVRVTSINLPPTASFIVEPLTGIAGVTEFTFDASGSTDPDGNEDGMTFRWNFGDGTPQAVGRTVAHTYAEANANGYTVTLTVTDERGATTSTTRTVVVVAQGVNLPPVAIIATGPRRGNAPVVLTFDARGSYDANTEDTLTYTWQFRLKQDGTLLDTLNGPLVNRLFSTVGTFTVELAVSDGRLTGNAGPVEIIISPPPTPQEPPPSQDVPDDNQPPPISADQRPGGLMCGMGMIGALFGGVVGLGLMRLSRRRFRL